MVMGGRVFFQLWLVQPPPGPYSNYGGPSWGHRPYKWRESEGPAPSWPYK